MRFLAAEGGKILGGQKFWINSPLVFGRSETRGELIQGIQLIPSRSKDPTLMVGPLLRVRMASTKKISGQVDSEAQ